MIKALPPVKGPVCGIYAAALASGGSFEKSMAVAKTVVAKAKSPSWRGRMFVGELRALFAGLGVEMDEIDFSGSTLQKVAAELPLGGHYVLFVTGHYLTLHGGRCYDQANPEGRPVEAFWCRRRRVSHVFRKVATCAA
jgi:hypothetical protein